MLRLLVKSPPELAPTLFEQRGPDKWPRHGLAPSTPGSFFVASPAKLHADAEQLRRLVARRRVPADWVHHARALDAVAGDMAGNGQFTPGLLMPSTYANVRPAQSLRPRRLSLVHQAPMVCGVRRR